MARFPKTEFDKLYPSDDACIDKIFQLRYGGLTVCPNCGEPASFRRVPTRKCYQCTHCYAQFYPTAGTPMEKTHIPLHLWLDIIHRFVTTRNGIAAKEIERIVGCNYKTAWRMGHQIRKLMGGQSEDMIMGVVELDESWVGGKSKNMHAFKRKKMKKETGSISNKTVVFGMLERGIGVRVHVLPTDTVEAKDVQPIIRMQVDKSTILMTDKSKAYDALDGEYVRESVNHGYGQYVREKDIHVNGIEGFWSQVKRTIGGTHIQVSRKWLPLYVNECAFRYNNVFKGEKMFDTILSNLPVVIDKNGGAKTTS